MSTYTSEQDGSEFLVLCNKGFQALYLPGSPIQLMNNNFEACTEQCAATGTSCAGATFGGTDQQECYLYYKMLASDAPAYQIVAAVRMSSSDGAPGRRQILQNSGFDGTLTPWTSEPIASGPQFTIVDNTATVRMSLASGANVGEPARLQQQISIPVGANTAYFTSMDITIEPDLTGPVPRKRQASGGQVSCDVNVQSLGGDYYVAEVLGDTKGPKTIYGSGTTQEAGIQTMVISVVCRGSLDVVVRFDNLAFSVFEPVSSEPGCETSLLTNGNFDSELSPWTFSQDASTSASVAVSGGQAVVRFGATTGVNDAPARLTQNITMPVNQAYRITAQLVFTIASSSCSVVFANDLEGLANTDQTNRSQTIPFTFNSASDIQATMFTIAVSCGSPGSGINSVGIDSVALVLNPGAECSSSSTTG
jgi:hypothetical protein